jgi:hypothetical protein
MNILRYQETLPLTVKVENKGPAKHTVSTATKNTQRCNYTLIMYFLMKKKRAQNTVNNED